MGGGGSTSGPHLLVKITTTFVVASIDPEASKKALYLGVKIGS